MIKYRRINNVVVKPIKKEDIPPEKIQGYDVFPNLYANIFICAPKNSGKTTAIRTILQKCSGPDTAIVVFASTFYNDGSWEEIEKEFIEKDRIFLGNTSIQDEGHDQLDELVKNLVAKEKMKKDTSKGKDKKKEYRMLNVADSDSEEEEKPKKRKKIAPEFILVFDDLGDEISKNKIFAFLIKKNRHFKVKTIISSQDWMDFPKGSRPCIDYALLFKDVPESRLKAIHEQLSITIPYNKFLETYYTVTSVPFSFLYIDRNKKKFRRNFNEELEI